MRKTIVFAVMLSFAVPAYGATSKTWKYNKPTKSWTVKTKKLKSTLEIIRDIKKKSRKARQNRR